MIIWKIMLSNTQREIDGPEVNLKGTHVDQGGSMGSQQVALQQRQQLLASPLSNPSSPLTNKSFPQSLWASLSSGHPKVFPLPSLSVITTNYKGQLGWKPYLNSRPTAQPHCWHLKAGCGCILYFHPLLMGLPFSDSQARAIKQRFTLA